MIFVLQGCSRAQTVQNSTIADASHSETKSMINTDDSVLSKSIPVYSDIHNIGIPVKTGQSELFQITQEDFLTITQEELTNYLNDRKKCEHHDWHAIIIDTNTAILCSYNQNEFIYGKWDNSLGITEEFITDEDPDSFYSSIVQFNESTYPQ